MTDSIVDVAGLAVGHFSDTRRPTGCTVVLTPQGAVCGVDVRGAAPGTRETQLLSPLNAVEQVHAVLLAGGSAFGLDAAGGVMRWLEERGIGFDVGPARVPIVPAAILFDLLNGGYKGWARNPYADLGLAALQAAGADFALGTAGAGYGAATGTLKGGLGSASAVLDSGFTVGALVAVNALGQATVGNGPQFWAAPWEMGAEFGGLGLPAQFPQDAPQPMKRQGEANTIAIVATDASLTQGRCASRRRRRMAWPARWCLRMCTAKWMNSDTFITSALPSRFFSQYSNALTS